MGEIGEVQVTDAEPTTANPLITRIYFLRRLAKEKGALFTVHVVPFTGQG